MSRKHNRILIVDDDKDILSNLSDILTDRGFTTETACDGPNALRKIENCCPKLTCQFDLCLLDFKMPGMDGVELLQKLLVMNPELRAIMITAYAGDDGAQRAIEAGTWRVMQKPVDIKKLLGLIDEAIAS